MNGFLNDMVTQAHPSNLNRPKPRVPIQYAHRRERDSFYELPQPMVQTLPAAIQRLLQQNKRHAVKVRVSHDQKTGEVLARIIKTRVQDLDIYIPSSPLDCRISVNLEMKYDGDIEALSRGVDKQSRPDRSKDRLSYTHSNYQIDLTQVTSTVKCSLSIDSISS
jgi:polynucleotide 5'-triphosphatase